MNFRLLAYGIALVATLAAGAYLAWHYYSPPPVVGPVAVQVGPARVAETAGLPIPKVAFVDVTEAAGVRFRHVNGAFGKKLLPETMGSGVCVLDYDNDGKPDLLFVNSCSWPGFEDKNRPRPTPALYRNLGGMRFEDVTAACGLAVTLYGMGAAAGDYDNDGWIDLFVSGVGGNRLFHNVAGGNGGRRFEDVTESAGVGGPNRMPGGGNFLAHAAPIHFPSSATFVDYDGDAKLDLFVCSYVTWSPKIDLDQAFTLKGDARAYGPPTPFAGTQCHLYRNQGNGTFADASAAAGIHVLGNLNQPVAKSLGVVAGDFDGDGRPDLVVANDTVRNFLFRNQGDGTFAEVGGTAGIALVDGSARGAMGVHAGEYRAGRYGLVIANYANEPTSFLRLDDRRQLLFTDVAVAEGVAGPSQLPLKWSIFFFDYDLDGRQDLLTCNGHLEPDISKVQTGQSYAQPVHLYWNSGGKTSFAPVTRDQAGPDLFKPLVGRGGAYADLDGDGDLDVILLENGGAARLLRNDAGKENSWIRFVLEGDGVNSNRSALGARVEVEAAGVVQRREICGACGYLSQSELAVTFGLGPAKKVGRVTIHWPGRDGGKQEFVGKEAEAFAPGKEYRIRARSISE